ncbi:hypothetical protein BGZ81_005522 [Podila clonocystis]|nr:hypothetical protein BGZ81_005522 [Podila clonocystis]
MRTMMRESAEQTYTAEIGKPMSARGVVEVIESKNAKYPSAQPSPPLSAVHSQLAGQLCKAWGLTVIGSVGSDDKVDYLLQEIDFDAALNDMKSAQSALTELAPQGIDIYFDCHNTCEPYGIKNLMNVIRESLTIRGFISSNYHAEYFADCFNDVREKLLKKQIVYRVDEAQGIDSAPEAFVGMPHC